MRPRGFTLLEMLIAIGITAALVLVAVQAHLGIEQAQARASEGLERERAAEVLLGRLERELHGAILIAKPAEVDRLAHPWVFLGADGSREGKDADALRFVTRTPARAGVSHPATGLVLVSYVTRPSDAGGLELLREEGPLPESLETTIDLSRPDRVADGLASFNVRYRSDSGGWVDQWNSAALPGAEDLPNEVEIAVRLWEVASDGEAIEGPETQRAVTLPVRAFDIDALRQRALGEEPEGECITVSACVTKYKTLISEADPELRELIEMDLEELSDQCFDRESPLADALRELGARVNEDCGP